MEDGLAHYNYERYKEHSRGLNPCCNGQWSRTSIPIQNAAPFRVLILIVVDNGLVPINGPQQEWTDLQVLILVVVKDGPVHTW